LSDPVRSPDPTGGGAPQPVGWASASSLDPPFRCVHGGGHITGRDGAFGSITIALGPIFVALVAIASGTLRARRHSVGSARKVRCTQASSLASTERVDLCGCLARLPAGCGASARRYEPDRQEGM